MRYSFSKTLLVAILGVAFLLADFVGLPLVDISSANANDEISATATEQLDSQQDDEKLSIVVRPRRVRRRRRRSRRIKTHPYMGLGGVATFVFEGDAEVTQLVRSGGGFNLFLGSRVSPFWAVELGFQVGAHNTEKGNSGNSTAQQTDFLQAATIDGKAYLMPKSVRMEPFLQVGVGYYSVFSDLFASQQLEGFGVQFGGGVDMRVNPAVGVGVRAIYKGVYVSNYEDQYWGAPPEAAFMNTMSGEVNVQFFF